MIIQSQETFKQQLLEQQKQQQRSQQAQFDIFMSTMKTSALPPSTLGAAQNVSLATGHLGSQSVDVPCSLPLIPQVSPLDKAKAWTSALPTVAHTPHAVL